MLRPTQEHPGDILFRGTYREPIGPTAPTDNAANFIQIRIEDIAELYATKADLSIINSAYRRLVQFAIASYDDGALLVGRVSSPTEAHEKAVERIDSEYRAYLDSAQSGDITSQLIAEQAQLLVEQGALLNYYESEVKRLQRPSGNDEAAQTGDHLDVGAPTITLAGSQPTVELELNNPR